MKYRLHIALPIILLVSACSPDANDHSVKLAAEASTIAKQACGRGQAFYGPWHATLLDRTWHVTVDPLHTPGFSVAIDAVTRKAGTCVVLKQQN
jgi:hypothetical protein